MSINIQLTEDGAERYRQYLLKELSDKKEVIKAHEKECTDIEAEIRKLSPGQAQPVITPATIPTDNAIASAVAEEYGYKTTWTWAEKIKFIFEFAEKEMTSSEVIKILIEFEPKYRDLRKTALSSVSAVFSQEVAKSNGLFGKTINERKENVYFLKPKE